jgi:hypothetical protein
MVLERARAIAQAELDLARVRQAKVALIECASAFPSSVIRLLNTFNGGRFILPKPIDAAATMPPHEPYRSAEAVRRVLPELRKLDRYEHRAAVRRDRAVLSLFGRTKPNDNL